MTGGRTDNTDPEAYAHLMIKHTDKAGDQDDSTPTLSSCAEATELRKSVPSLTMVV